MMEVSRALLTPTVVCIHQYILAILLFANAWLFPRQWITIVLIMELYIWWTLTVALKFPHALFLILIALRVVAAITDTLDRHVSYLQILCPLCNLFARIYSIELVI
jgi:hypothetical protein